MIDSKWVIRVLEGDRSFAGFAVGVRLAPSAGSAPRRLGAGPRRAGPCDTRKGVATEVGRGDGLAGEKGVTMALLRGGAPGLRCASSPSPSASLHFPLPLSFFLPLSLPLPPSSSLPPLLPSLSLLRGHRRRAHTTTNTPKHSRSCLRSLPSVPFPARLCVRACACAPPPLCPSSRLATWLLCLAQMCCNFS